ncbi:MAG: hypothetical protein COY81_01470 [Candidatus Pacebacteria bacterium CG_4_10_14_0_8_um_filter_43_12]|nr:MAG: hypothetical protein COY81_01470 [Candidatus Pacebacteria bacterium CG_4_10_14_0_8_um_filter_43_12]
MAKNTGLGALLTGIVLGAAAVFLSKKENRIKTRATINQATTKVKLLKQEYKTDPEKVKAELKAQGKKLASKALTEAHKLSKRLNTKPKTSKK